MSSGETGATAAYRPARRRSAALKWTRLVICGSGALNGSCVARDAARASERSAMAFGSEACRTGSASDPSMTGRCSSCAVRVSGEKTREIGLVDRWTRGGAGDRGMVDQDGTGRNSTGGQRAPCQQTGMRKGRRRQWDPVWMQGARWPLRLGGFEGKRSGLNDREKPVPLWGGGKE